jgi:hypothetical protein
MRKFLTAIFVLQEKSNRNRSPKLGRGFDKAHRINPLNPLSYIAIVITIIIGVLMFGFVGIKKEMDFKNPFKWD